MFYETEKPGLTNDPLVYHGDTLAKSYSLWKEQKASFLSINEALRKEDRDPIGLTPSQPNIELFNTECYGRPKNFDKFPIDGKQRDPNVVLNKKLMVKGVKGLRVVDYSIMPKVNSGHTQMPAYGIGKKVAGLIKAAWA
ncbi:hypothetical protein ACJ41O_006589 [Fusarium nematophilum]